MSTPGIFLNKAERALVGAHTLLRSGDSEGACSRAYYAMFDGARAALMATAEETESAMRTHRSLIAAFGQKLVRTGFVDAAIGRAFNQVQEARLIADYTGDPVQLDIAEWAVAQAEVFLAAVRPLIAAPKG